MIFTPEESREIAVGMLGWHWKWETPPCGWWTPDGVYYPAKLPDFSDLEWTGAMLEKVFVRPEIVSLDYDSTDPYTLEWTVRRKKPEAHGGTPVSQFWITIAQNVNLNRALYDAWKFLKEASDVQP